MTLVDELVAKHAEKLQFPEHSIGRVMLRSALEEMLEKCAAVAREHYERNLKARTSFNEQKNFKMGERADANACTANRIEEAIRKLGAL